MPDVMRSQVFNNGNLNITLLFKALMQVCRNTNHKPYFNIDCGLHQW